MFEFIDPKLVTLMLLLLMVIYLSLSSRFRTERNKESQDREEPLEDFGKSMFFMGIVFTLFVLYRADATQDRAKENTQLLAKGMQFECKTTENTYLVSKKDGWRVEGNYYFTNATVLVRADKCEEF